MSKELKTDSLEVRIEKRKKKLYKYLKKPLGLTEISARRNLHEGEYTTDYTGTVRACVKECQLIEMCPNTMDSVHVFFNISLDKLDELLVLLERD